MALALSPQFSIDPARAPFEVRWPERTTIAFLHEADPPPFVETAIIVYDRRDEDARHARLYRRLTRVVDVALVDCGHPSTGFLAELDLLQRAVVDLAAGRFDAEALRREARRRRRQSGQFFMTRSHRVRGPRRRLAMAERAVTYGERNIQFLTNLARVAAQNGEFATAMATLARCAEIAPAHPVVCYNQSEVLELAGDLPAAVAVLENFPDHVPRSEAHTQRIAYLHARIARGVRRTDLPAAVARMRRRLAGLFGRHPPEPPPAAPVREQPDVLLARADDLERGGRLDAADAVLAEAVASWPYRSDLLARHAFLAERRGDLAACLARWELATARFPEIPLGHAGRGGTLKKLRRLDEARTVLDAALLRFPDDANICVERAWVALDLGEPEDALARARDVIARFPERLEGPACAAAALRRMLRFAEADAILLAGLRDLPDHGRLAFDYAVNASDAGDRPEALRRWLEVRAKFPDDPLAYAGLGTALKDVKRFDEADAILSEGMRRFPDNANIGVNHAWVAEVRQDWPEALRRWEALACRFPADARVQSCRSEALNKASLDAADRGAEASLPPTATAPHRALLTGFENLGENCELGFVQRHFGAEPLGLLRWAGMPRHLLLQALETEFAGVGEPETTAMRLDATNHEYVTSDTRLDMNMHSFIHADPENEARIFERMCRRLRFLRDRLLSDLREGAKIFVFQAAEGLDDAAMCELHDALGRYGHPTLLCIRPAGAGETPGEVAILREGLLAGWIDRPGFDGRRWDVSFDLWLTLCTRAQALRR